MVAAALDAEALAGACFAEGVCVAGLFLAVAGLDSAAWAFPPDFLAAAAFGAGLFDAFAAGACFAAGRACLEDLAADLAAAADLRGAAFFTGAFSAAARFGLGFADSPVGLRPLPEDFGAALCGAGREELLFAPLMTGSLMRSTRFSQNASHAKGKPPTSSSLTHEKV